jgi:hypothetical protein
MLYINKILKKQKFNENNLRLIIQRLNLLHFLQMLHNLGNFHIIEYDLHSYFLIRDKNVEYLRF